MRFHHPRGSRFPLQLLSRLALLVLLLSVPYLRAQTAAAPVSDEQVASRAESLLKQMTLQEKIGQMTQLPGVPFPNVPTPDETARKGMAGSMLWVSKPAEINRLQKIAVEESRLHIPILFGLDVVQGYNTVFPAPLAMAASWDPALVERAHAMAAKEARAAGILWTFAPMVDVARDPRWGRIVEGAGEDPFLGSAMARAQVLGFQGKKLGGPDHILATVKHFAAYGAADGGRDYDSSYVSEDQLWNVYFPPFKAAVDAGVGTLMSAYMDLNDVPATGNRFLLRDVLRDTWGFKGFVVSDALAVRSLITHGFARDAADAALKAMDAGVNMDMVGGIYITELEKAVKSGKVTEAQIDEMVRPILEAKIRLGLFENPYLDEGRMNRVFATPEHAQLARTAAQRSIVLLRNEKNLLPLDKKAFSSIAVIGPVADNQKSQIGMWGSISGTLSPVTTVLQGIRNAVGTGVRVEYAKGPVIRRAFQSPFEESLKLPQDPEQTPEEAQKDFANAVETAKKCDIAIMVLGETAVLNGEYASRSTIDLAGRQQELLEAVAALGKPVVLVLIHGRPLNVTWASEHIPAIVAAWVPGTEGGNAVADVLFGNVNPGGKLPVSWPRSTGQVPVYYAHNLTQIPETSPEFKSRYSDILSTPLYPFGYGLSFTTFSFSNLKLSNAQPKLGESFQVSVDVQNTGKVAGDEVVQLYVHQRAGSASRPVRELKGFERVTLAPGEKKTVQFTIGKNELSYWSARYKKWIQETEEFDVWVGGDSKATLHGEFKVQ